MKNEQMTYRRQDDITAAEQASDRASTRDFSPSLTLQAPALDCDINSIAKAYGLTARGAMPVPPEAYDPAYYADLSDQPETLADAITLVQDAQRKFDALPVELRAKFNYSPGALWDWVNDPRNTDEAVKLGLFYRPPVQAGVPAPEPEKPAQG